MQNFVTMRVGVSRTRFHGYVFGLSFLGSCNSLQPRPPVPRKDVLYSGYI